VTQRLGTIWLKEGPGPFDTLEKWEHYLTATKSMPDCLQKSLSVQQTRKVIAQKRKEARAGGGRFRRSAIKTAVRITLGSQEKMCTRNISIALNNSHHLLQQKAPGGALDLREIGETNVDAGLQQPRQEHHRTGQSIDLADNERCAV
jgi:hypothetical protein